MLAADRRGPTPILCWLLALQALPTMAQQGSTSWEMIKHKFVGGPYAGAGGMAIGGGSVGVAAFASDAEAIKAIRMFPGVMVRPRGSNSMPWQCGSS